VIQRHARGIKLGAGRRKLVSQSCKCLIEIRARELHLIGDQQCMFAAQRRNLCMPCEKSSVRGLQVWPRIIGALPAQQGPAKRVTCPGIGNRMILQIRVVDAANERHSAARVALGQRLDAAADIGDFITSNQHAGYCSMGQPTRCRWRFSKRKPIRSDDPIIRTWVQLNRIQSRSPNQGR
jgi:hypothetical protein